MGVARSVPQWAHYHADAIHLLPLLGIVAVWAVVDVLIRPHDPALPALCLEGITRVPSTFDQISRICPTCDKAMTVAQSAWAYRELKRTYRVRPTPLLFPTSSLCANLN